MSYLLDIFLGNAVLLAAAAGIVVLVVFGGLLALRSRRPRRPVVATTAAMQGMTAARPAAGGSAATPPVTEVADSGPQTTESEGDYDGDVQVGEVDPLSEAAVYAEFGYIDRAVKLLRWYVDESGSAEPQVLRKLLKYYIQLSEIDAGAEMLDRLCLANDDPAYLREAVLGLLRADPGNLQVRVVAENRLGMGPDKIDSLLGIERKPARQPAPAAPATGQAVAKKAPAGKAAASGKAASGKAPARAAGKKAGPAPAPARPAEQARSAPAAPPHRGAHHLHLVQGKVAIDEVSESEREAVHAFMLPEQQASLFLEAGHQAGAVHALKMVLQKHPSSVAHLGQLARLQFQVRDVDGFARTVWQISRSVGRGGGDLKERFLSQSRKLGEHPVLSALASANNDEELCAIGRRFGYLPRVSEDRRVALVLRQEASPAPARAASGGLLEQVDELLEYGNVDEALSLLESSLLADPNLMPLYAPLLDLYERMDGLQRLTVFGNRIKKSGKLPQGAGRQIMAVYQRMKGRMEKAVA